MGFSPLIRWQNLIYFAGDKRGEGLLYSLACSYSAPVLYKPDNKYGTRQGCPLWKELFSTKVIMLDQCSPNSRLKRHTRRWSSASKYVTALGFFLMVQQAKVHTTYLQLCGCFYSAHTIHLSQLSEKWHTHKTNPEKWLVCSSTYRSLAYSFGFICSCFDILYLPPTQYNGGERNLIMWCS